MYIFGFLQYDSILSFKIPNWSSKYVNNAIFTTLFMYWPPNINLIKGPSKNVNIFTSVQTVH